MFFNVSYFGNFETECHLLKIGRNLLKIGSNESSFTKYRKCQCNLKKKKKKFAANSKTLQAYYCI